MSQHFLSTHNDFRVYKLEQTLQTELRADQEARENGE